MFVGRGRETKWRNVWRKLVRQRPVGGAPVRGFTAQKFMIVGVCLIIKCNSMRIPPNDKDKVVGELGVAVQGDWQTRRGQRQS